MSAYVIQAENGSFVDYDDKPGPMSTGYPYLTTNLAYARLFHLKDKAIESAIRDEKDLKQKLTVKELRVV